MSTQVKIKPFSQGVKHAYVYARSKPFESLGDFIHRLENSGSQINGNPLVVTKTSMREFPMMWTRNYPILGRVFKRTMWVATLEEYHAE